MDPLPDEELEHELKWNIWMRVLVKTLQLKLALILEPFSRR